MTFYHANVEKEAKFKYICVLKFFSVSPSHRRRNDTVQAEIRVPRSDADWFKHRENIWQDHQRLQFQHQINIWNTIRCSTWEMEQQNLIPSTSMIGVRRIYTISRL